MLPRGGAFHADRRLRATIHVDDTRYAGDETADQLWIACPPQEECLRSASMIAYQNAIRRLDSPPRLSKSEAFGHDVGSLMIFECSLTRSATFKSTNSSSPNRCISGQDWCIELGRAGRTHFAESAVRAVESRASIAHWGTALSRICLCVRRHTL